MNWTRWLPLLVIILCSGLFAYYNGAERITLSLGFTTVYRVSLVGVVFGAFLLGMVSMFVIGLRQDLRLRRELRDRGLLREPRPRRSPEESPTEEWRPPAERH